jgi:hypothetical protein
MKHPNWISQSYDSVQDKSFTVVRQLPNCYLRLPSPKDVGLPSPTQVPAWPWPSARGPARRAWRAHFPTYAGLRTHSSAVEAGQPGNGGGIAALCPASRTGQPLPPRWRVEARELPNGDVHYLKGDSHRLKGKERRAAENHPHESPKQSKQAEIPLANRNVTKTEDPR